MLTKTHLAIGCFFMVSFLPKVNHKVSYILLFFIATLLPNIDSLLSGSKSIFLAPLKLFFKKRGFLHSFTFCFAITGLLVWFWPIVALPFFLGYGIHLIVDSWTVEGIVPFWPIRSISKGRVRTGGSLEHTLFYIFVIVDVVAISLLFL
ncbi:metal-dependent hydrolase [Candidatus Pacearchaeota archaeon]|nr:metal-dependent hydrolase [Candidatus Pacearchaeota archaeon]